MISDEQCAHLGIMQPPGDARDTLLGTVEFADGSWIEVSATVLHGDLPFWNLLIYTHDDDRVVKMETGTGPLKDFWPFASAIAEAWVRVLPLIENLTREVERASAEPQLPPERRLSLYRKIANAARAGGFADTELRRGAVQIAWDARREMHEAERRHHGE